MRTCSSGYREADARHERPDSAFISRGACHELFEHCVRHHELVLSAFILEEFERTLLEKFGMDEGDVAEAVALLRQRAEIVEPVELEEPVSRDPDDDRVLATALAGACACIVTGDKDLLVLEEHEGIAVLSPSNYWAFEARRS